jgi:predicted DCC family thiol-disulfide oxidoreductase YuxK
MPIESEKNLGESVSEFFFDSDCGICTMFVAWAVANVDERAIVFTPYSSLAFSAYEDRGIDPEYVDHGVQLLDEEGQLHKGASAIAILLQHCPHWQHLGNFLQWPGVRQLSFLGYRVVAFNRQRISRALALNSCKLRIKGAPGSGERNG